MTSLASGQTGGGGRGLAIAGLSRLSTCDWPDKLVATVFLQGCPWNCGYCHNPDLIDPLKPGVVEWSDVIAHLTARRGLLDGLVFSGGEPTRQDLRAAIGQVRELGFGIGLHTSGGYPRRLAEVLPLVDWVGLDIKALPADYAQVTGVQASGEKAAAALRLVLDSGVDYQIRTTWGPGVMSAEQAEAVRDWVRAAGGADPVLQDVRPDGAREEFVAAYRGERRAMLATAS